MREARGNVLRPKEKQLIRKEEKKAPGEKVDIKTGEKKLRKYREWEGKKDGKINIPN